MSVQYGGDKITFSDGSTVGSGWTGFKNRIINGDMRIDQRNAGASITPTDGQYSLDRWRCLQSVSSKYSVQQNAGSVTPPAGFTNYLGVTSLSAYSVGSSEYFFLEQNIEGFNFADMAWGTANASPVTLSFWVRSSLTGTFGGAFRNNAANRSYPFAYTISAANTWEYKTITVAGDTTGTWVGATNGKGCELKLGLGVGSSLSGTAGAWAGSNFVSATGATSVVGTNGATFYITGVQLEKGSTATSFDYRPYGTELALCQRYFYRGVIAYSGVIGGGSGTVPFGGYSWPETMRASPTATWNSGGSIDNGTQSYAITSLNGLFNTSADGGYLAFNIGSNATIGRGCCFFNINASFSAEL